MNINRNNYEEFFLLYTDNELNAQQKTAVDAFIQQNPDLAIELETLQQTVMPIADLHFEGKEMLFRNEAAFINSSNSEEKFLLYVDDELNSKEKTEVETFVLQHPQLQEAFTLLKQTKLEAETIPHPNKEELYRKEKRRVIYLSWQRMAIAAAVLGLIVLGYTLIQKPAVVDGGLVITKPATAPSNQTPQQKGGVNNSSTETRTTEKKDNNVARAQPATQPKKSNNLPVPLNKIQQQNIITPDNNNTAVVQNKPVIKNNDILTTPVETIVAKNDITDRPIVSTAALNSDNNNYVQPAVYKELNTEEENNAVYVGNMKLNKDKVKSLLKKAGRLFSRPRDEEEAKLSIASIPVKQSK